MSVSFDHSLLPRSLRGPQAAFAAMFPEACPRSLVDVGCGLGVWAKAALRFGVSDVLAVDGVNLGPRQLVVPSANFRHQLLNEPFSLGRKFDVAVCLEVGEHLDERYAEVLISNLVRHSDAIYFSAACPGQPGQNHVNCQWPIYWQRLFNEHGFTCDDSIRWRLWNTTELGFCYRQNMFLATKDPARAGREPRILPVVHPELVDLWEVDATADRRRLWLKQVEHGSQTIGWYLSLPVKAFRRKLNRKLFTR
jgi:hypothetical protein